MRSISARCSVRMTSWQVMGCMGRACGTTLPPPFFGRSLSAEGRGRVREGAHPYVPLCPTPPVLVTTSSSSAAASPAPSTAMFLARAGLDVLVVDRGRSPLDVPSTHVSDAQRRRPAATLGTARRRRRRRDAAGAADHVDGRRRGHDDLDQAVVRRRRLVRARGAPSSIRSWPMPRSGRALSSAAAPPSTK